MAKKKSPVQKASKFLVGASVAAAVTGGVIAFLTQTKHGQKMTKDARKQVGELSKHVAMKAEKMKDHTKKAYDEMVDEAVAEYQKKKKLTQKAAEELGTQLKAEWTAVKKELKKK